MTEPAATIDKRVTVGPELLVLIPVYHDWDAVSLLLVRLDHILASSALRAAVLIVDDGSTTPPTALVAASDRFVAIYRLEILTLRLNRGHQRAIALGLAYVEDRIGPDAVLIMDGDGEDAPEDVPRLAARMASTNASRVIFAERTRRSESLSFRVCYGLYRQVHRVLTGIPVRVGNFSIVPAGQLRRLVVIPELWNHYAAAVFKARLPRDTIPTIRAKRLSGQGRMNLIALIGHGLSALSVHSEVIGVRLLATAVATIVIVLVLLGSVLAVRMGTPLAIPGWATTAAGLLLVLLVQAIAFALVFVFLVLHGRSQPLFIATRDYHHFVGERTLLVQFAGNDRTHNHSITTRACFEAPKLALELLDKAAETSYDPQMVLPWRQVMRDVWKLSEFKEYVRRRGYVDYWRKYGWADACHQAGDDFECG